MPAITNSITGHSSPTRPCSHPASRWPSSPGCPARPPPPGISKCVLPKMAPDILFTAEQIQERVRAIARQIAAAPLRPDICMPVLVGGFVFAADLLRALSWEGVMLDVEMIWLRSYGDKRVASAISMIAGPSEQIAGRHVLVIDGVLDAGRTIAKAVALIQAAGAASVQVAVMLDKQRPDAMAHADFVGFTIGDDFVVGYG